MKLEVEDKENYRVVHCFGTLDGSIRKLTDDMIHPLIEDQSSRILVDLSGGERITTEAIGVFVTLVSRCNAKGSRVVFANPSPFVRAIFDATKITKFLETEDTIEEGVKRLLGPQE